MRLPFALVLALALLHLRRGDPLSPDYYAESCPLVEEIVRQIVRAVTFRDPTMAASLLRLHFHDCFVLGCDGSILLDNAGGILSEKGAAPNLGSVRGFEVVDRIKVAMEEVCPFTVSCADILALVARDSVYLSGGPNWKVSLGRRDSLEASFGDANRMIPAPNFTLDMLISNFESHGLDAVDLITLSGGHTIGRSRCASFKQRLYNDESIEGEDEYMGILRSICPQSGKRDNSRVPLDLRTSMKFDNFYYLNLISGMGLLQSDQELSGVFAAEQQSLLDLIWAYAGNQELFFREFVKSMLKMAALNVLTGEEGEVRRNCRFLNPFLTY